MGEMKQEEEEEEVNNGVKKVVEEEEEEDNEKTKTTTAKRGIGEEEEEEVLVEFMDSMDTYLSLMDSLSSTLRQGWLELASARHSMGSSRISSNLLDLSQHSAHTTIRLFHPPLGPQRGAAAAAYSTDTTEPQFTLNKWGSTYDPHEEADNNNNNNVVQQQRSKSLSVFGGLVSPKLRAAQLSFENALEVLVDVANTQSSILSTFEQVRNDVLNTNTHHH